LSIWNKDFGPYVWPWLEPVMGVFLLVCGVRTIITQEYRYHMWVYHGAMAELAGVMMLLGAYLFFRGKVWRRRGWENWSLADKVVGGIVGAGMVFFAVLRWIDILR
jgi:hypothetical protein